MESDNPNIKWALDLLTYDPLYEPHFIAKYWLQIPSVFSGPAIASYINYTRGLKLYARKLLFLLKNSF